MLRYGLRATGGIRKLGRVLKFQPARQLIKELLDPAKAAAAAEEAGSRRASNRSAVESAKAQIQPLVLEHMDIAAAAEKIGRAHV